MLERLRQSLARQQAPFGSDSKKPRGAVAVLLKEEVDELQLLMMRRRDSPQDPWSGQMAFPGGHAESQDRSLSDTAARETQEEVGIDVRNQIFLGCLRNVEPKNAPMIVAPFVFLVKKDVHPSTSREAEEIVWVPIPFLLNPTNVSSIMVSIGDKKIPMGCYNYSGHIIWGMSFRIIREIVSKIMGSR
jgi:8-oxo-dGTP pyrophosphatase MutT (NUDIX family)